MTAWLRGRRLAHGVWQPDRQVKQCVPAHVAPHVSKSAQVPWQVSAQVLWQVAAQVAGQVAGQVPWQVPGQVAAWVSQVSPGSSRAVGR